MPTLPLTTRLQGGPYDLTLKDLLTGETRGFITHAPASTVLVNNIAPRFNTGTSAQYNSEAFDQFVLASFQTGGDRYLFEDGDKRFYYTNGGLATHLERALTLASSWATTDLGVTLVARRMTDVNVSAGGPWHCGGAASAIRAFHTSTLLWGDARPAAGFGGTVLSIFFSGLYLFVAVNGANFWRWDGTSLVATWAQPFAAQAIAFARYQNTLYRATGATIVPATAETGATWGAAVNVGDPNKNILDLYPTPDYLAIAKPEGWFLYDGTTVGQPRDWSEIAGSTNGIGGTEWHGAVYTGLPNQIVKLTPTSVKSATQGRVDITEQGDTAKEQYGHGSLIRAFQGPRDVYFAMNGAEGLYAELLRHDEIGLHVLYRSATTTLGSTVSCVATGTEGFLGDNLDLEYWHAMSFTPAATGTLARFTFTLRANTGSPVGVLNWDIQTDNAGAPSGTVLKTGSLTPTASAINEVAVSSGPTLTTGVTYWLVLRPAQAQATNVRWNWDAQSGVCAGNRAYSTNGGSSWTADAFDLAFSVITVASGAAVMRAAGYSALLGWLLVNDGTTYRRRILNAGEGEYPDYATSGNLITPYLDAGYPAEYKAWLSVELELENADSLATVKVEYQGDAETAWTEAETRTDNGRRETLLKPSEGAKSYKKIRFRLTLARDPADVTDTPRVVYPIIVRGTVTGKAQYAPREIILLSSDLNGNSALAYHNNYPTADHPYSFNSDRDWLFAAPNLRGCLRRTDEFGRTRLVRMTHIAERPDRISSGETDSRQNLQLEVTYKEMLVGVDFGNLSFTVGTSATFTGSVMVDAATQGYDLQAYEASYYE